MIDQRYANNVAIKVVSVLNSKEKGNLKHYLFKRKKELLCSSYTYVSYDGLG